MARNDTRSCLGWSSKFFRGVLDVLASRAATDLARELGVKEVIIEGDCASVIFKLKSSEEDASIVSPIICKAKSILAPLDKIEFLHAYRECYSVAHTIAKYSTSHNDGLVYLPTDAGNAIEAEFLQHSEKVIWFPLQRKKRKIKGKTSQLNYICR
ncbi:hypothetical protein Salat_1474000 [Sesamum alatum]|uniref:RNase H type-1 domain-containing protein n=1 Tax=Sesamum alatum TaxID=300844 RepID=A0AAE1YC41_9LAMI|nr:hypothetical protein Salat_1474000 [Sesamum alatum]